MNINPSKTSAFRVPSPKKPTPRQPQVFTMPNFLYINYINQVLFQTQNIGQPMPSHPQPSASQGTNTEESTAEHVKATDK
jgi:hypothetical protein